VVYSSEATFVLYNEDGEFLTVPEAVSTTELKPQIKLNMTIRVRSLVVSPMM